MGREEVAKIDYSKAIEIYSQLFEALINKGRYSIYLIGYHNGLDCNKILNVFAISDKSIKLWNLNDLTLIIYKKNAHSCNYKILKLQFTINNIYLISSDLRSIIKVWDVNYQWLQLELVVFIMDNIRNISLDIDKFYFKIIKIFTIKGEIIGEFNFELNNCILLLLIWL